MVQSLNRLKESPSQTAGPYVHIGLTPNFCGIPGVFERDLGASMVNDKTKGERITIRARVLDGTGTPLKDAPVSYTHLDVYKRQVRHRPRSRRRPRPRHGRKSHGWS